VIALPIAPNTAFTRPRQNSGCRFRRSFPPPQRYAVTGGLVATPRDSGWLREWAQLSVPNKPIGISVVILSEAKNLCVRAKTDPSLTLR